MKILERAALRYAEAETDADFARARRALRRAVYAYVRALGAARVSCACGCGAWWYCSPLRHSGRPRKYLNADHRELAEMRRSGKVAADPSFRTVDREACE